MPSNIEQLRELRRQVERLHRKSIGMIRIAELVSPPCGARRHLSLRGRKLRRDDQSDAILAWLDKHHPETRRYYKAVAGTHHWLKDTRTNPIQAEDHGHRPYTQTQAKPEQGMAHLKISACEKCGMRLKKSLAGSIAKVRFLRYPL
jgi:hypothetical protein